MLVAPTAGPIAAAPAEALAPPSKPVKTASIDSILASTPAVAKPTPAAPPAKAAAKTALASAKPAATADKPSDKTAGFVVQIGAFSSQIQADKSWESAAGVAPGAMVGKGKHIAPMSKDGATLYRVAITGFDNRAQAQALCAKLSAAGKTCFVR